MDKFYTYTFEDFLDDPSFIRFVKGSTTEDTLLWQHWLDTDPDNLNIYLDARAAVLALQSVKPIQDTIINQDDVWRRIEETIILNDQQKGRVFRLHLLRAAAAAAILLLTGTIWYYRSKIDISTAYGEHRAVRLPDGSLVRMNANSRLTYWRAWRWHTTREAWLQGEALFDVVHRNQDGASIAARDRFYVHAGAADIHVLGTLFNVKSRREKVLVSLIRGRINISSQIGDSQSLVLTAGEAAVAENRHLRRQTVAGLSNRPTAWTSRAMETRSISVADIIEDFEDTFGQKVVVDHPTLLQKRIDGHISLESPESTIYMLSNLLNVNVQQRDGTYYLKSK